MGGRALARQPLAHCGAERGLEEVVRGIRCVLLEPDQELVYWKAFALPFPILASRYLPLLKREIMQALRTGLGFFRQV